VEIIIAILGSGALSALISGLFGVIHDRKAKKDGVRAGVRQLLYERIKFLGRKYIANNEITSDDLEDLIDMHKIYHDDLNGNGYLDDVIEKIKKLKVENYLNPKV
jgi:hypothetical protein